MSKVLVIGAGGVSSVCVHKMAMNSSIFSEIHLASRTIAKCDAIAESVRQRTGVQVATYAIDAEDVPALTALIRQIGPKLVVNLALPYQDLPIMDACLEAGVDYLDTANYEPKDEAKFEYKWQWAYQGRFREKGLMALLGSGFDPGVTSVFAMWLKKHKLKTIRLLDILDCNGGDHGQHFATNFNPEINIREVTARGRFWKDGAWHETDPISVGATFDFPGVGEKKMYLLYHEELESLSKNYPTARQMRFWMTFSDSYLTHLRVLENVGMTSIKPVMHEGREIIPLQFLKAVLPDPGSLGAKTVGKTCIGDLITGVKDGQVKHYFVWNVCDHEECFRETGAQGVSYTTGVPAMIGAKMILEGKWKKPGVWNMEQNDPDPFMADMNKYGLPWQEKVLDGNPLAGISA